jgi:hypothetical protein
MFHNTLASYVKWFVQALLFILGMKAFHMGFLHDARIHRIGTLQKNTFEIQ